MPRWRQAVLGPVPAAALSLGAMAARLGTAVTLLAALGLGLVAMLYRWLPESALAESLDHIHDLLWLPLKGHLWTAFWPLSVGVAVALGALLVLLIGGWVLLRPPIGALHEWLLGWQLGTLAGVERLARAHRRRQRTGRQRLLGALAQDLWQRGQDRLVLQAALPVTAAAADETVRAHILAHLLRPQLAPAQERLGEIAALALLARGLVLLRVAAAHGLRADAALPLVAAHDRLRAAALAATERIVLPGALPPPWHARTIVQDWLATLDDARPVPALAAAVAARAASVTQLALGWFPEPLPLWPGVEAAGALPDLAASQALLLAARAGEPLVARSLIEAMDLAREAAFIAGRQPHPGEDPGVAAPAPGLSAFHATLWGVVRQRLAEPWS